MRQVGLITIGILILLHVAFFVLEAVVYESNPEFRNRLGFRGTPTREEVVIACNQGVSNAFLAMGLALGLYWYIRKEARGASLLRFQLCCVAIAGIVGFTTVMPPHLSSSLVFLVGQTSLAILAWFCLEKVGTD